MTFLRCRVCVFSARRKKAETVRSLPPINVYTVAAVENSQPIADGSLGVLEMGAVGPDEQHSPILEKKIPPIYLDTKLADTDSYL